ncbi:MAG: transposase, family [Mycobacteriales bacterium]
MDRSARLREVVGRLLSGGWSPASIAGRLPVDYATDQACRVSHGAIYQWVYAQPVSSLAGQLIACAAAVPPAAAGPGRLHRGSASPATSRSARLRPGAGRCPGTGRATW